MKDISGLRRSYEQRQLVESDVDISPIVQFREWFSEAIDVGVPEPNAFTLATVDQNNMPNARIVLLKDVHLEGFTFYTNYASTKGQEMEYNPNVAMCFLWHEMERQVRIRGHVEKLPQVESEAYFHKRPRPSQIGAIVSDQSQIIANHEVLTTLFDKLDKQYEGMDKLPKPEHWGGYLIRPVEIEFWQGRPSRLHDRIVYLYDTPTSSWNIVRRSP